MIHLVTSELDQGPVATYCSFPIVGGDFDPLWMQFRRKRERRGLGAVSIDDGEREPLFAEVRRRGALREIPLIYQTVRQFVEGAPGGTPTATCTPSATSCRSTSPTRSRPTCVPTRERRHASAWDRADRRDGHRGRTRDDRSAAHLRHRLRGPADPERQRHGAGRALHPLGRGVLRPAVALRRLLADVVASRATTPATRCA